MITFQFEPWAIFEKDSSHLWEEQYLDVGSQDFPVQVDSPLYSHLESQGQLQILTVRKDGVMIAYTVLIIRRHSHYPALCGFEDAYYVKKSERKAGIGRKLIQETLRLAQERGVKKVFFYSNCAKSHRALFLDLGFAHSDEVWSKVLK
jgi:L-amino acid N-acyltransferase YncA